MKLLLKHITQTNATETDITNLVDVESPFVQTRELERDAFQRTVSDLYCKVSDFNETVSNEIWGAEASDKFILSVVRTDGIITGKYVIDRELTVRSAKEEKIIITAFSQERAFWDWAAEQKMQPIINAIDASALSSTTGYIDLEDLMDQLIASLEQVGICADYSVPTGIQMRNNYVLNLQFGTNAQAWTKEFEQTYYAQFRRPENKVRIGMMAPDMTVQSFLYALLKYHNLELLIDPNTDTLTIHCRNTVINDRNTDLSSFVVDETDIQVVFSDTKKYDFIKTYSDGYRPPNLVTKGFLFQPFDGWSTPGLPNGSYDFIYTVTDTSDNESRASDVCTVILAHDDVSKNDWGATVSAMMRPMFQIPTLPNDYNSLRLYYRPTGSGSFIFCKGGSLPGIFKSESQRIIEMDTPISTILAIAGDNGNIYVDDARRAGVTQFMSVDDVTGTMTFTLDDPAGNVFDTIANIQFVDVQYRDVLSQANAEDLKYFFNGPNNTSEWVARWSDLLETKRRVITEMYGTDYQIGDGFTLYKIAKLRDIKQLIVKKAEIDEIKETTRLELIEA